jgi:hypothetical protein
MGDLLINIIVVLIFFGGPLLPLFMIAGEVGRWHERNQDPPMDNTDH